MQIYLNVKLRYTLLLYYYYLKLRCANVLEEKKKIVLKEKGKQQLIVTQGRGDWVELQSLFVPIFTAADRVGQAWRERGRRRCGSARGGWELVDFSGGGQGWTGGKGLQQRN